MPFHKAVMEGIRQQMAWSRAKREATGYGEFDSCPYCHGPNNKLIKGGFNPISGIGCAMFECATCLRIWSFSRYAKQS